MSEPETPRPETPAAQPSTGKDEPRTAVAERPAPASAKPPSKNLPPYRVLLHNDDVNEPLYVVATLMELALLGKERSLLVMMEAEQSGVALVLVTHKERAELYQEQFQSKSLVVSIEPAEA